MVCMLFKGYLMLYSCVSNAGTQWQYANKEDISTDIGGVTIVVRLYSMGITHDNQNDLCYGGPLELRHRRHDQH